MSSKQQLSGADKEQNEKATQEGSNKSEVSSNPQHGPSKLYLIVIMCALLVSTFLVALDLAIVSTAIPKITDQFHQVRDIGWYGAAFFLTLAVFPSFWGKMFTYFPLKSAFLVTIFLFELGSLVSALAPSSTAFIVGRAIAGWGAAGITGGSYVIVAYISPPQLVPAMIGLIGSVYSVAGAAGPLIGGVFSGHVTWRWCFYINLPIGGLAFAVLFFVFRTPTAAQPMHASWKEIIQQLDVPGTVSILAATICFTLALEWGGVTKPWSSSDVIGTLVGWVVLTVCFACIQWRQNDRAMIAPRILKSPVVLTCSTYIFFLNCAHFLMFYYLPLYFQAADGASPTKSGIRTLALIISNSLTSFVSSAAVAKTKYFSLHLAVGSVLLTVGSGLLYTLEIGSSVGKYVGYQIIFGAGLGISINIPIIVCQAFSAKPDIPATTSIVLFFQLICGSLSIPAAQSIFENVLIHSLTKHMPSVEPSTVLNSGATELRTVFKGAELQQVLDSYLDGIKAAWLLCIVLSAISFLVVFAVPFKRLPTP